MTDSENKNLELFATNKVFSRPCDVGLVRVKMSHLSNVGPMCMTKGDESEHVFRGNEVGDVEAYFVEEDMDHGVPYVPCHALDSKHDGTDVRY